MKNGATGRWLALGALALATLTIGLDTTVLTITLPTLAVDLHADTGQLQWFSTAYTLVLAAAMLPAGALGDRLGRKKMLLAGMGLFGAASAVCALATSAGQLIGARALLGLAAAVMMPLSMAVLPILFPDPVARGRATTIWVTASGIGMPLGPLLGGWLLREYWWGSVFLINVPVVLVAMLAVAKWVPESRSAQRRRFDVPGIALSSVGLAGLTYGFIRAGQRGWGDAAAWTTIAVGVALLAVFVVWQRRAAAPLIDLALFADKGFRWGTVYSILLMFAVFGVFFTAPQYFQSVLGVDALGSGVRLLPMIAGLVVGARAGERLTEKVGARTALVVGFATMAAGMALGAATSAGDGYGFAAIWLVIVGFGMGLAMPTAMNLALGGLTAERSGSGSALMQALRQAGGTIGVAVLGTVLSTQYRGRLGALNHAPISDGVNAGVQVARRLHDSAALAHVQSAFVSGMSLMLLVCAAISVASLAVVAIVRVGRAPQERPADAAESIHVG
jgi:EmrB/QacA subfamily drug resistance transporter